EALHLTGRNAEPHSSRRVACAAQPAQAAHLFQRAFHRLRNLREMLLHVGCPKTLLSEGPPRLCFRLLHILELNTLAERLQDYFSRPTPRSRKRCTPSLSPNSSSPLMGRTSISHSAARGKGLGNRFVHSSASSRDLA